jgi:hypothetical protein
MREMIVRFDEIISDKLNKGALDKLSADFRQEYISEESLEKKLFELKQNISLVQTTVQQITSRIIDHESNTRNLVGKVLVEEVDRKL